MKYILWFENHPDKIEEVNSNEIIKYLDRDDSIQYGGYRWKVIDKYLDLDENIFEIHLTRQ